MAIKYEEKEISLEELISLLMGKVDKEKIKCNLKSFIALKHHFDTVINPMYLGMKGFIEAKEPSVMDGMIAHNIKAIDGYAIVEEEQFSITDSDGLMQFVQKSMPDQFEEIFKRAHPRSNSKFFKENHEQLVKWVAKITTTKLKKVK